MKKNNELKSYEWKIYNYLKERSKMNLWTRQSEIQDYLNTIGFNIGLRAIRKAITNIRQCDIIQKIIISSPVKGVNKGGYRILSKIEEAEYLRRKKIIALTKLKQYYKDCQRLSLNGQTRIAFTPNEREFIESML